MIHPYLPQVFGERYELITPLGEGGFAVTYHARDRRLARDVAVKVLRRAWGSDATAEARFEREAQAAAAVSSPFVVPVYDYGIEAGIPYIVMELVRGGTLRDRLDHAGRLPPDAAVAIAVDMLRGLAAIHASGIIHRDVKPQNVLLDRNGTARMTDFGVASRAGAASLTQTGTAHGTALYMAPEQIMGEAVGPATDLYAVGVVLFEMLTGRPPFTGTDAAPLFLEHVQRPAPLPSEVAPDVPLALPLEREVMRALAKHPGERRSTAAAMAAALIAAVPTPADAAPSTTTEPIPVLGPTLHSPVPPPSLGPARPGDRLAWLGPLVALAAALAIVIAVIASGQLRGLFGAQATVTPVATAADVADLGPPPSLTPVPIADRQAVVPEPTGALFPGQAAPAESISPTQPVPAVDEAPAGAAPTPATQAPAAMIAPTESPAPTATPEPTPTALPTATVVTIRDTFGDAGTADETLPAGTITFQPGDWIGGAPPPPEMGREAVALYGADGAGGWTALRFTLEAVPAGRMVLTLNGLGDESGLAFPFGIEVNGMYIGQSPSTFSGWSPADDGINGERAAWDQVRLNLPAEVFQPGENEIALVSLMPGDYADRPPYLLLGEAVLTPK